MFGTAPWLGSAQIFHHQFTAASYLLLRAYRPEGPEAAAHSVILIRSCSTNNERTPAGGE